MIRVLFICLGNICRSPMAEFILKHKVKKLGLADKFYIDSAATSTYEIGSDMHRGSKAELDINNIEYNKRSARQVNASDYDKFDYIIYMDSSNYKNLKTIFGGQNYNKLHSMMSFVGSNQDVADPWYTGNFSDTYRDIDKAIDGFLQLINIGSGKNYAEIN